MRHFAIAAEPPCGSLAFAVLDGAGRRDDQAIALARAEAAISASPLEGHMRNRADLVASHRAAVELETLGADAVGDGLARLVADLERCPHRFRPAEELHSVVTRGLRAVRNRDADLDGILVQHVAP